MPTIIGKATLYNSDCMTYMATLPDKAFDLAIVDPPYGIGADEVQNEQAENGRISNGGMWKKYKPSRWDAAIPEPSYFDELLRVSKHQIIWGGNHYPVHFSGVVIWYKGKNGTMKDGEFAKASINTFKVFELSRVDAYVNCGDEKIHPTQKPVKLYEWLLANYAKPGQRILDTHLGSMSSVIASNNLGFEMVGCELDEDYFKAGCERATNALRQVRMFD